jgi:hypothetical protein
VEIRVDFVGDPIVFEKEGEESSKKPEQRPATEPKNGERRDLKRNVNKIGCGVAEVGEESKGTEGQKRGRHKSLAKMWPSEGQPEKNHRCEKQVIEQSARLPEAGSVKEGGARGATSGTGRRCRLSGKYCGHSQNSQNGELERYAKTSRFFAKCKVLCNRE